MISEKNRASDSRDDISLRKKRRIKNKIDRGSEMKLILSSIFVLIIIIPLFIFLVETLSMSIE